MARNANWQTHSVPIVAGLSRLSQPSGLNLNGRSALQKVRFQQVRFGVIHDRLRNIHDKRQARFETHLASQ